MGMSSWTVSTPTVGFPTASINFIHRSLQYRPYFEQFPDHFFLSPLQIPEFFSVFFC